MARVDRSEVSSHGRLGNEAPDELCAQARWRPRAHPASDSFREPLRGWRVMSTTVDARGLSERTIAAATRQTVDQVTDILGQEWRRGTVEPAEGGWRLTADAERRFGEALRSLGAGPI